MTPCSRILSCFTRFVRMLNVRKKTKVPSTYDDLTNMTADLAAAVLSEMSGIPHKSQGYSYQNIRTYIKISKREATFSITSGSR